MKADCLVKHIPVIIAACIGVVVLSGRIDLDEHPDWDLEHYRAMAAAAPGISDDIPEPFAYRLLGPYTAGLIPIDDADAFYLLAILSALFLMVAFYMFLCGIGIADSAALYAVMLFSFNWFFLGFNIWNYFQLNDLFGLLSLVLAFWAMSRRQWLAFSVAMAAGVLARVTPLVMIPVAFVYLVERKLLRTEGLKLLASAVPAVIILALARILVHASGGVGIIQAFLVHTPRLIDPGAWFSLLISPYAPLTLLPLVFFRQTVDFLSDRKYLLVYLVLVVLGTFQGANNERLIAPAFVVFYMLIAVLTERTSLNNRPFLGFLLAITFLRGFYHLADPGSLPTVASEMLASTISTAVVTAAALWLRVGHSRRTGNFLTLT